MENSDATKMPSKINPSREKAEEGDFDSPRKITNTTELGSK
jgi:hypothetical protein